MNKNWLEVLCELEGITFYELSKRTGVAQSTLSNIRKKNISFNDVRLGTALSIAYGFNLNISTMIDKVIKIELNN